MKFSKFHRVVVPPLACPANENLTESLGTKDLRSYVVSKTRLLPSIDASTVHISKVQLVHRPAARRAFSFTAS